MQKKILKFSLKLLVSLAFLAWIFFEVDWQEVFSLLKKIKPAYIAAYFFFLVCGMAISAYKWKILAAFKGINLSFSHAFRLYLTGTFINNFMPSFIGGDAYRIYQSGREEKKYSESATSVVMDRLTGLFGAMLLALVFSAMNFQTIADQKILLVLDGLILTSVAGFFIFFLTRKMPFWQRVLETLSIRRLMPEKISGFLAEVMHYSQNSGVLWRAMAWSVLFGLFGIAMSNYVLFLALGERIDALDYLSVIFLISFVSSLPISINNIGVKEWAYVTFFGFFGVASPVVITVAILSRLLQMLFSFLAWPMYLRSKK